MANVVSFEWPVAGISGKVGKRSHTYRRKMYGKWREVYLENPRTREKSSVREKAYRAYFRQLRKEALEISRDSELSVSYTDWFEHQTTERNLELTGKAKIYFKKDLFILACLLKERPFVE